MDIFANALTDLVIVGLILGLIVGLFALIEGIARLERRK